MQSWSNSSQRLKRLGAALLGGVLLASGCSSSSLPATSSTNAPTSVAIKADELKTFDQMSAKIYPGTTLDQRTSWGSEVCKAIDSRNGDVRGFLTEAMSSTIVPFKTSVNALSVFTGASIKALCPNYLPNLMSALSGTPTEINLGTAVLGTVPSTVTQNSTSTP